MLFIVLKLRRHGTAAAIVAAHQWLLRRHDGGVGQWW